jgi:hypothetical protein
MIKRFLLSAADPVRVFQQFATLDLISKDWQIEGLLNVRKLTLEWQFFLDEFNSLSEEAQRQVTDLVIDIKQASLQLRE